MTTADDEVLQAERGDLAGHRHLTDDLGVVTFLVSETRCLTTASLTDAVRGPAGNASLGVLMTVFDTAASRPGMIASDPDWTGLLSFARLPRTAAPGMDGDDPRAWVGQIRPLGTVAPATGGALHDRMGLRVLDAETGQVELHRTPYVSNSIGTILGGAQAVMVGAAAEAMRPGTAAVDMQVH